MTLVKDSSFVEFQTIIKNTLHNWCELANCRAFDRLFTVNKMYHCYCRNDRRTLGLGSFFQGTPIFNFYPPSTSKFIENVVRQPGYLLKVRILYNGTPTTVIMKLADV